jgi:hypothetical protein
VHLGVRLQGQVCVTDHDGAAVAVLGIFCYRRLLLCCFDSLMQQLSRPDALPEACSRTHIRCLSDTVRIAAKEGGDMLLFVGACILQQAAAGQHEVTSCRRVCFEQHTAELEAMMTPLDALLLSS